jgi:hypothetical protein
MCNISIICLITLPFFQIVQISLFKEFANFRFPRNSCAVTHVSMWFEELCAAFAQSKDDIGQTKTTYKYSLDYLAITRKLTVKTI